MPRAVISAAVDLDTARRIAEEATERGLKLSRVVDEALRFYLDNHNPQKSGRVVTVQAANQISSTYEEEP